MVNHETAMGLGIEPWRPDSQPSNTSCFSTLPFLCTLLCTGFCRCVSLLFVDRKGPKEQERWLGRKVKSQ